MAFLAGSAPGTQPSISEQQAFDEASDVFFSRALSTGGKNTASKHRTEDARRLKELLTKRGDGSFLRGWRRELDPDGDLEVNFQDYIKAAARMTFYADALLLFGGDNDCSTLTIEEVAPFEGDLVQRFKAWIAERFSGHKEMFQCLQTESTQSTVSVAAWCKQMPTLGFDGLEDELKELFNLCDVTGRNCLKQEDLIFLERDELIRADEFQKIKVGEMLAWRNAAAQEYIDYQKSKAHGWNSSDSRDKPMSPTHRLAPRAWLSKTFESLPTVICHQINERMRASFRKARRARIDFFAHLKEQYGNEVRALRRALSSNQYCFSQMTLRNYIRRCNLKIDHRVLWQGLDRNNDGICSLEELAVHHALALANFQRWARRNPLLGSCAAIWEAPEAAAASRKRSGTWFSEKKMLVSVFQDTLEALGWPGISNPKMRNYVFQALDLVNCGLVTRADLQWVDHWRPVDWVYAEPDEDALQELKALLIEAYDHPLRAWRCLLDTDDSNSIDYGEFVKACRKCRFGGNPATAWRALDKNLTGCVTMNQWDPESAELLHSFKEWTEVNFGSVVHFFRAFDTDGSGSITLSEMKNLCHKLHWSGDPTLIFECLDVDRKRDLDSKRNLSMEEVAFLDKWVREPTEEEMAAEDAARQKPKPKPQKTKAAMDALLARLSDPYGQSAARPTTSEEKAASGGEAMDATRLPQPAGMATSKSTGALPRPHTPLSDYEWYGAWDMPRSASKHITTKTLRYDMGPVQWGGAPTILGSTGHKLAGLSPGLSRSGLASQFSRSTGSLGTPYPTMASPVQSH